MKIRKQAQFSVSNWSGGSTTQLAIFPENASLLARDFDWRISSAVVEVEESDFTLFEGYERILIHLSGNLEMTHQTPNGELLQKVSSFELARFSGDWLTKGKGKVTDFNFIFKSEIHPKIDLFFEEEGTVIQFENCPSLIYVFEGAFQINEEYIEAPALISEIQHNELVMSCLSSGRFISVVLNEID
jgi:uncharacterized protein